MFQSSPKQQAHRKYELCPPQEFAILAQVVFSWSLLVVSENYLSVEAMLQSPPVLSLGGMCFVRKLLVEWIGEEERLERVGLLTTQQRLLQSFNIF